MPLEERGGVLYEAWRREGNMLQGRCLEARRAPLKIVCVAIHLLQIPIHCTQFEMVCPVGSPAAPPQA